MARFVLVHAAWHGGWCFQLLARELEDRGHEVSAPDLPCDRIGLTQEDYGRVIGPQSDAVVIGHSLGGQTIQLVEARMRIYLAAILPVENVYSHCFAAGFGGLLRDDLGRSYWPDPETTATRLYPDCTREQSDRAFAQLRHQAPFDTLARPFADNDVIVATLRDRAVDADWQVRTAREHGVRLLELDAGHSPFFTQPAELAILLESVA